VFLRYLVLKLMRTYKKHLRNRRLNLTAFLNNNNCVRTGRVPDPTSLFLPTLFLYVILVTKGAPKFFKTMAPQLTVLDIPYFADAHSRTVRPIDF
jgi:hypothetical protein